jgi:hypothetical protein
VSVYEQQRQVLQVRVDAFTGPDPMKAVLDFMVGLARRFATGELSMDDMKRLRDEHIKPGKGAVRAVRRRPAAATTDEQVLKAKPAAAEVPAEAPAKMPTKVPAEPEGGEESEAVIEQEVTPDLEGDDEAASQDVFGDEYTSRAGPSDAGIGAQLSMLARGH